mgnify:CR=1
MTEVCQIFEDTPKDGSGSKVGTALHSYHQPCYGSVFLMGNNQ